MLAIGPKRVGSATTTQRSPRRRRYDCGRPPPRVRRRPKLADEAKLLERGLELRPELAPLDARERAERGLDGRPLPVAGEVRAQPRAQIARLPDVEHRVVAVAEEVDARRRRRAGDQRAARVQPPRARRGELDHLGERPRAALLREPEQRDEDLGRRERVGQRAVARLARRAEEVRELASEKRSLRRCSSRRASQTVSTTGRGDPPAGQPLDGVVEEADVEAGVVRGERRVAGEREEAPDRELRPRRAAQLGVAQARQPRDRRRQRDARVDERLERLGDLERLDAHRADLAHPVARRAESPVVSRSKTTSSASSMSVSGVRPSGEPDARAEPREARVAVDDVGEQGVRQRRGRALEREEHARRLLRAATAPRRAWTSSTRRSAASNESCIAAHRRRTYVRVQGQTKGRPETASSQSSVSESR